MTNPETTSNTLSTRREFHLPRRIFHMLGGTILVLIAMLFPSKGWFVSFLFIVTLTFLLGEALRLALPRLNAWFIRTARIILREGEQDQMSGSTYYLIGCTISAIVFPTDIALLAILYLAFGDPVASLIGIRYGRAGRTGKSWEGSAGCFAACFLLTILFSFFLPNIAQFSAIDRLIFACLGGAAATIGELIPFRTDDNLALPIVSGALLWLAASMLNLYPGLYF